MVAMTVHEIRQVMLAPQFLLRSFRGTIAFDRMEKSRDPDFRTDSSATVWVRALAKMWYLIMLE